MSVFPPLFLAVLLYFPKEVAASRFGRTVRTASSYSFYTFDLFLSHLYLSNPLFSLGIYCSLGLSGPGIESHVKA